MIKRPVYSFFWSTTCSPTCIGSGAAQSNSKLVSDVPLIRSRPCEHTVFIDRCETTDQETKGDEQ